MDLKLKKKLDFFTVKTTNMFNKPFFITYNANINYCLLRHKANMMQCSLKSMADIYPKSGFGWLVHLGRWAVYVG